MAASVTALDDRRSEYLQKKGRKARLERIRSATITKAARIPQNSESAVHLRATLTRNYALSDRILVGDPRQRGRNASSSGAAHGERISERARARARARHATRGNCMSPARASSLISSSKIPLTARCPAIIGHRRFLIRLTPRAQMRLTRKSTRISGVRGGRIYAKWDFSARLFARPRSIDGVKKWKKKKGEKKRRKKKKKNGEARHRGAESRRESARMTLRGAVSRARRRICRKRDEGKVVLPLTLVSISWKVH